jgi:hypothetical protein
MDNVLGIVAVMDVATVAGIVAVMDVATVAGIVAVIDVATVAGIVSILVEKKLAADAVFKISRATVAVFKGEGSCNCGLTVVTLERPTSAVPAIPVAVEHLEAVRAITEREWI